MTPESSSALAKAVLAAPELLKEIYGDLAKPGVTQVGKALGTVLGLGNTILLPIQFVNDLAHLNYKANYEAYRKKLEDVPEEEVVPVPPEIGVPIVEKFSYLQDVDLRELFTNLLTTASVRQKQSQAHPSFVNIINNLSPDEARLLEQFKDQTCIPFISAKWLNEENGQSSRFLDLHSLVRQDLSFPANTQAYVSNLDGLGLIDIRRDNQMVPADAYEQLEKPIHDHLGQAQPPTGFTKLVLDRGRMDTTPFGRLFFQACVLERSEPKDTEER